MSDFENGIHTHLIYGDFTLSKFEIVSQYLIDSVDILSFWNHIPLLIFVKSRLNPRELQEKLTPFFNGGYFIVIEIDKRTMDGRLNQAAWDWFSTPAPLEKKRSALHSMYANALSLGKNP